MADNPDSVNVGTTPLFVMGSDRWANLSPDGVYRYDLGRRWDESLTFDLWVMLNPSTADALEDDPTIRRCVGFSRSWGAGGIVVVNLYALRATNPTALLDHWRNPDPEGPENAAHVADWMANDEVGRVIVAWGAFPIAKAPKHTDVVGLAAAAGRPGWCLGKTKRGEPRHPLYLSAATSLTPYWSVSE
jgi:hypothetical protein